MKAVSCGKPACSFEEPFQVPEHHDLDAAGLQAPGLRFVVAYLHLYFVIIILIIHMHTYAGVCHAQSFVKSRPMTTDWLNWPTCLLMIPTFWCEIMQWFPLLFVPNLLEKQEHAGTIHDSFTIGQLLPMPADTSYFSGVHRCSSMGGSLNMGQAWSGWVCVMEDIPFWMAIFMGEWWLNHWI